MSGNGILRLSKEELLVKSYLERAIGGSGPSAAGLRLIHRFATELPEVFSAAALSLLQSEQDSPALRFMAVKLLQRPALMEILTDPERLKRLEAVELFRVLKSHDRALDVRMARCLPDRYGTSEVRLTMPACNRALDVLDEASDGKRIVPILGHLIDHPIPALAAKATLVIGKRVQSVPWVKRVLSGQRDARDRANAIQSLWGCRNPGTLDLMWDHVGDKSNRVRGNAVLGLHLLGQSGALTAVHQMSRRPEPPFRWTSAWLMSKVGEPQYLERLKELVKDANPGVRRAALKALVSIRQEQLRKEEQLRIEEKIEQQRLEQEAPAEASADVEGIWPTLAQPEFDLRLDGRSFSFRP